MKDYVRLCQVSENQLKNTRCDVLLITVGIQQPKHHLQYTSCIATFNGKCNIHRHFCRDGLVVGRPTAVREDPGLNLTAAGRVYHDSHCDIQPWARVVHPYCSA